MTEIKKVLSIDMDTLAYECIQIYNDLAGSSNQRPERNHQYWQEVKLERGCEKYLEYDKEDFQFLKKLVKKNMEKLTKEAFFFGVEHDSILEFLMGDAKKDKQIYEIYNIDHHHDIYYSEEQKENIDRFDFAGIENWVYYMGKYGKIKNYFWAGNKKSFSMEEPLVRLLPFSCDFKTYWADKMKNLWNIDFDYIYICLSPEFFPEEFHFLFYCIRDMVSQYFQCSIDVWEDEYCINRCSRPYPGKGAIDNYVLG